LRIPARVGFGRFLRLSRALLSGPLWTTTASAACTYSRLFVRPFIRSRTFPIPAARSYWACENASRVYKKTTVYWTLAVKLTRSRVGLKQHVHGAQGEKFDPPHRLTGSIQLYIIGWIIEVQTYFGGFVGRRLMCGQVEINQIADRLFLRCAAVVIGFAAASTCFNSDSERVLSALRRGNAVPWRVWEKMWTYLKSMMTRREWASDKQLVSWTCLDVHLVGMLKNRRDIGNASPANESSDHKRKAAGIEEEVEEALKRRFSDERERDARVTGPLSAC